MAFALLRSSIFMFFITSTFHFQVLMLYYFTF
nr:MAG TPA: hypothetical protein [Bacteriophage sp.]